MSATSPTTIISDGLLCTCRLTAIGDAGDSGRLVYLTDVLVTNISSEKLTASAAR